MLGQRACVHLKKSMQQRDVNVSHNVVFKSNDNDACDVAAMSQ